MRLPTIFAALAATVFASCGSPQPPATTTTSSPVVYPKLISKSQVSLSASQESQARSIISQDLKDPQSAQFRSWQTEKRLLDNGKTVLSICGEINAKNSYGAYTGFRPFNVTLMNGQPYMSEILDPSIPVTTWVLLDCKPA
jgi:hypothetical protein